MGRRLALGLAFVIVMFTAATAQPAPDLSEDAASVELSTASAADPEINRLTIELERERLRASIARTRFAGEMDAYQTRMYRHHQFWTDTAAVAVYVVTGFGLLCAAAQFRLVARLRGVDVQEKEDTSAGEVELPGGAKVSSPFLGVIILFLSLAFFYLYLTNVYPIVGVAELEAKRVSAPADNLAK